MKIPKTRNLFSLALVAGAVAVSSATFAPGVSASGNQSCVNLVDMCVGAENSTSPTHYRGFAGYSDYNFSGLQYSDGTAVEDRVNAVRVRTESPTYSGVCFYRDANQQGGALTWKLEAAGWFDNSSTGISSSRWLVNACL